MNIEKNVPMPEVRSGSGQLTSIIKQMSVGDSVVTTKGKAASWHSSARVIGVRLATRKISETETRVWRVK